MFNFIYDYKIRKQCKKSHVILREEFKRRTDTLLSHLPKENGIYKENKRRMVVLPALIAVLLISIPAAAAVNYYQQRMEIHFQGVLQRQSQHGNKCWKKNMKPKGSFPKRNCFRFHQKKKERKTSYVL